MAVTDAYSQLFVEDLLLSNQWEVIIPDLTETQSHTKYLVKTVNLPFWKPEVEGSASSGMKYYKGINRDLNYSIEFNETAGNDSLTGMTVYKFMKSWQNEVFNRLTMNFAVIPKKRDILIRITKKRKEGDITIKTFTMKNSMVTDIDDYSLSYDTGEPLITKVNFQCDYVDETY